MFRRRWPVDPLIMHPSGTSPALSNNLATGLLGCAPNFNQCLILSSFHSSLFCFTTPLASDAIRRSSGCHGPLSRR